MSCLTPVSFISLTSFLFFGMPVLRLVELDAGGGLGLVVLQQPLAFSHETADHFVLPADEIAGSSGCSRDSVRCLRRQLDPR